MCATLNYFLCHATFHNFSHPEKRYFESIVKLFHVHSPQKFNVAVEKTEIISTCSLPYVGLHLYCTQRSCNWEGHQIFF